MENMKITLVDGHNPATLTETETRYIVDITREELTKKDIKVYVDLHKTLWEKSEPTYFGPDIHPAIEFSHFDLVPIVETVKQVHRKGGRVKDPKPVWRSLSKGYKLTNLPPAVLRIGNEDHELTGATRKEFFSKCGREFIIVAVFVPKTAKVTQYELEDAISYMGQSLQPEVAANPNSIEDIKAALTTQCRIFKESGGTAGVNPFDYNALLERTKLIGASKTETKQYEIAQAVFNHYSPEYAVASWSSDKKAAYRIESYLHKYQLVDSENVMYICAAASTVSKVFTKALAKAANNPGKEIRIIFHTSTLTGADPIVSFESVAGGNIDKFNQMCSNAQMVFKGDGTNPISVYGVLPAVGSVHSWEEPVLYNAKNNTLYQRNHPYFYEIDTEDSLENIDLESDFSV
jgi:hypothetical protein